MDVTRIYVDELPDRIAAYLKPVCPTYHRAIQIAKMCDCHTALLGIRNLAYGVNGLPATPNEVEKLKDILNRALRGRV